MKVKIAYTVDIENIPKEVERLHEKLKLELKGVLDSIGMYNKTEKSSIDLTAKNIEDIRLKMAEADVLLSDVHMILLGYMNVISSPPSEGIQQGVEDNNAIQ